MKFIFVNCNKWGRNQNLYFLYWAVFLYLLVKFVSWTHDPRPPPPGMLQGSVCTGSVPRLFSVPRLVCLAPSRPHCAVIVLRLGNEDWHLLRRVLLTLFFFKIGFSFHGFCFLYEFLGFPLKLWNYTQCINLNRTNTIITILNFLIICEPNISPRLFRLEVFQ